MTEFSPDKEISKDLNDQIRKFENELSQNISPERRMNIQEFIQILNAAKKRGQDFGFIANDDKWLEKYTITIR